MDPTPPHHSIIPLFDYSKIMPPILLLCLVFLPSCAPRRPITEKAADLVPGAGETMPARPTVERLPNGGWTYRLADGTPFLSVGIEYEPLSHYNPMEWSPVEQDLDLIRDCGFNTLTIWCVDFHASWGAGSRMTIEQMVGLAERARERGLFIQFYLNIDRFIDRFPHAVLPDGQEHHFDIDYWHPDYRAFVRSYARELATTFLAHDNVFQIVIWEEKIGLDAHFGETVTVQSLFASAPGKQGFQKWLRKRHGSLETLNRRWGTSYPSFAKAVDASLLDYLHGVSDDDHRQHDILEFGAITLTDFTRDFVEAYKAIDPGMLFQCRNFELFGPVHALHPDYALLDSFGINQYAVADKDYDLTFRREVVMTKLVSGIAGTAPAVGNFGFRTVAGDGGTHGLVPDDHVKAAMACDSLSLFSFLPEMAGSSYFMYRFTGREGKWDILERDTREPLPVYHAFKALNTLLAQRNEEIALTDYAEPASINVFHGLDAIFDIRQSAWLEHFPMVFDLTEMNLNYEVITDANEFDPARQPVILATYHAYDKKLDTDVARRLLEYCREGGTLVIANRFGDRDRYLWPQHELADSLHELRGVEISDVRKGEVNVTIPGLPPLKWKSTYYVEADLDTLDPDAQILCEMAVNGRRQPGLIRRTFGQGSVYYFLFNPLHQGWWGDKPDEENRTSLPVLHFLCEEMGIEHDTQFGNRGFNLSTGRINVHEEPIHYSRSKEAHAFGTYADEYGEDAERYSGGVITDDFISFRGRNISERGWEIRASQVTSLAAAIQGKTLSFFTLDPVDLTIRKDGWEFTGRTEPYKVYRAGSSQ